MHTGTNDIPAIARSTSGTACDKPRRQPTPEDPTPNWRTHGELPDDRRYPALCPSTERYTTAKLTDLRHACRCGVGHDAAVYTDGTMHCERTDSYFTAAADAPELQQMRREHEDYLIRLMRACELS